MNSYLETGAYLEAEEMLAIARTTWRAVYEPAQAEDRFVWGKEKPENLRPYLVRMIGQFLGEVTPLLDPVHAEYNFDRVLLLEDDVRRIYLSGTIDLVDRNFGVLDWKTASRAYQRWEHQRWAVQPTVYTFAAAQLGLLAGDSSLQTEAAFTYVVFVKGKAVQILPLSRCHDDWDWLRQKLTALAIQVETSDPAGPWLLNDTGWWCSPDWCSKWAECKGASYPTGWKT